MAENNFQVRIMQKHDTEANWSLATNFIPKAGELIIYDIDASHSSPRLKIGNGIDTIISLPFITGGTGDIGNATILKSGLMSAEDKRKLNNIEENATSVYVDSILTNNSSNAIQNKAVYNALEGKANTEHTHDSGDIEDLSAVATSGSFTDLINRPSIPVRVSQLVNDMGYVTNADIDRSVNLSDYVNDVGFVTSAVNNLTNYYNKTNSYSKTEINNMLNELSAFEIRIVDELPETGESNCFYLIKNEDNENSNYYDEYLWISEKFELIGNTKVDLSDYLTKIGNSSNTIVDFEVAAERVLPTTGQKLSGLFGRIVKFLTDLKPIAFSGSFNDLNDTENIVLKGELSSVALSGDFNDLSNIENIANKTELAEIAFSGSYNDLKDIKDFITKTELSEVAISGDFNDLSNIENIADKTELAAVAFSGSYNDLKDTKDFITKSELSEVALSGNFNDLSGTENLVIKENLKDVAFSGSYNDLTDTEDVVLKTQLNQVAFSGDFNDLSNTESLVLKTSLKDVAFSGSFNDLSDTETIVLESSLKSVAFSGDFNDLSNTEELATKSEVNNKQDILSGTEGQVVQFDNEGKPVASTLDLISVNDIDTICGVNN